MCLFWSQAFQLADFPRVRGRRTLGAGVVPAHAGESLITAQMRARIVAGEWHPGQPLPSLQEIMREHGCSMGTAHRAVALLAEDGLIVTGRGFRAIVGTAEPRI